MILGQLKRHEPMIREYVRRISDVSSRWARRLRWRLAVRWLIEVAGVAVLAWSASTVNVAIGAVVVGVYLIVVANTTGGD